MDKLRSLSREKIFVLMLLLIILPVLLIIAKQKQDPRSSAAAPDQLETEGGVLSALGVIKQSDSQASGGEYVTFATQTPTPTSQTNYGPRTAPASLPAGTVYRMPTAYARDRAAQDQFVASVPNGTASNPSIIVYDANTTWYRSDAEGSTESQYLAMHIGNASLGQPARSYLIFWGYGAPGTQQRAKIHSDAVYEFSHFRIGGWANVNRINHHIKILGFELEGGHTNAATLNSYGYDHGIAIAMYGLVEDIEIADNYIHNTFSDSIYIDGNGVEGAYTRAKRVNIHHNTLGTDGRSAVVLDQGEDIYLERNIIKDSAGSALDIEDARAAEQSMNRYYIRDNIFDGWDWSKGSSYFRQIGIGLVNERVWSPSKMSASDFYIERNVFRKGPMGWGNLPGNDPSLGDSYYCHRDNDVIAIGPAGWMMGGANYTIPKTNFYIRDNDFSQIPANKRCSGGISLGWTNGGAITGNNMAGFNIYSIGNTNVTVTNNPGGTVKTSWP